MDAKLKSELLCAAWKALENSYAPYSKFNVGAAVLGSDGKLYSGCNIENSSYGLTVCGERNAIFNMVSQGVRSFSAMACVTSGNEITTSCGACRQVMGEFAESMDIPVVFAARCEGELEVTLAELMPYYMFDAITDGK